MPVGTQQIDINERDVKSLDDNFCMKHKLLTLSALAGLAIVSAQTTAFAADPVDFVKEIKPILEANCVSCHGAERPKGGLSLVNKAAAFKEADGGVAIVPGKPDESSLYTTTILPPGHDNIMPPKGPPLTKGQTDLLKRWIEEGAKWPEDATLSQVAKIDFVKDIQPILELNCVSCHTEGHAKGGLRLDTKAEAFKGGANGNAIVPGKSSASLLYTSTILPADHNDLMPPTSKGGPLPKETAELLRQWIDQGAHWPDDAKLTQKKAEAGPAGTDLPLVEEIYKKIAANVKENAEADMKQYTEALKGTEVKFDMLPIPSGEYLMGSPAGEAGRKDDEGPQHKVKIAPFWMGKCEVTWNEFELFMYPDEEKKLWKLRGHDSTGDPFVDTLTRPTRPYVEMSFGMGKDGFPAISMTQHAANKYCQWLSARTGHFYRLPTEAEWEYAARAGTTTKYSFGDDESQLGDYAWFADNSDFKYQKVGKKKPNPWGLHDIHGNVIEWTLDQYSPDFYKQFENAVADNPWNKATKPYPHSARGGSWDDDPSKLRSSMRRASDKTWKIQDPQLPKSIWYHTDAQFLGFRVVRPLKVPTAEEMQKYWTSGVQKD